MKKVQAFELTNYQDRRDLQGLMNDPKVQILNTGDFFGVGRSEDGPEVTLTRVVDYRDAEAEAQETEAVYVPPIC